MDYSTIYTHHSKLQTICKERNWKCRLRNRHGDVYVTVWWTVNGWNRAAPIVNSFFPSAYMTSGNCFGATYRVNP